jgi:hypothetical protein
VPLLAEIMTEKLHQLENQPVDKVFPSAKVGRQAPFGADSVHNYT